MTVKHRRVSRASAIALVLALFWLPGCGKYGKPIRSDGTSDKDSRKPGVERDFAPDPSGRYEPIVDETSPGEPGDLGETIEPDDSQESDEPAQATKTDEPSDAGDETDE